MVAAVTPTTVWLPQFADPKIIPPAVIKLSSAVENFRSGDVVPSPIVLPAVLQSSVNTADPVVSDVPEITKSSAEIVNNWSVVERAFVLANVNEPAPASSTERTDLVVTLSAALMPDPACTMMPLLNTDAVPENVTVFVAFVAFSVNVAIESLLLSLTPPTVMLPDVDEPIVKPPVVVNRPSSASLSCIPVPDCPT